MFADLPDTLEGMLSLLAKLDLASVRHVHEQLAATTEPRQVASLSRAYVAQARSARLTLAQLAKVRADAALPGADPADVAAQLHRLNLGPLDWSGGYRAPHDPARTARRADQLRVALKRVIAERYDLDLGADAEPEPEWAEGDTRAGWRAAIEAGVATQADLDALDDPDADAEAPEPAIVREVRQRREFERRVEMRDYFRGLMENRIQAWMAIPGFAEAQLDAHVVLAAQNLGLPLYPAATWRELPDPPWADDPVPWEDDLWDLGPDDDEDDDDEENGEPEAPADGAPDPPAPPAPERGFLEAEPDP